MNLKKLKKSDGSYVSKGDYCIYIGENLLDDDFKCWNEKIPLKCLDDDPWGAEGQWEQTTIFEGEPECSGEGFYGFSYDDYLLVNGYNKTGYEN